MTGRQTLSTSLIWLKLASDFVEYRTRRLLGELIFGVEKYKKGDEKMAVQWKKDADATLTEAKSIKMPVLIDFSAAPG